MAGYDTGGDKCIQKTGDALAMQKVPAPPRMWMACTRTDHSEHQIEKQSAAHVRLLESVYHVRVQGFDFLQFGLLARSEQSHDERTTA